MHDECFGLLIVDIRCFSALRWNKERARFLRSVATSDLANCGTSASVSLRLFPQTLTVPIAALGIRRRVVAVAPAHFLQVQCRVCPRSPYHANCGTSASGLFRLLPQSFAMQGAAMPQVRCCVFSPSRAPRKLRQCKNALLRRFPQVRCCVCSRARFHWHHAN